METKGTQVDEFDPVYLKDTIKDLRKGLRELDDSNDHINAGIQERQQGLEETRGKLERLFGKINDLLDSLRELQAKTDFNQQKMVLIDRKCEQLQSEKGLKKYKW